MLIILPTVAICVWKRRQRTARVKHSGASLDLGKDEGAPSSTSEALPYIVNQWYAPRNSGRRGRAGLQANEKRASPQAPADAPLLQSTEADVPVRETTVPTGTNRISALAVHTASRSTTNAQTNAQTNNAVRSDQVDERPRVVRQVDTGADELPPEYRDWGNRCARG